MEKAGERKCNCVCVLVVYVCVCVCVIMLGPVETANKPTN